MHWSWLSFAIGLVVGVIGAYLALISIIRLQFPF